MSSTPNRPREQGHHRETAVGRDIHRVRPLDPSLLEVRPDSDGIPEMGHVVQFYDDDAFLLDAVTQFIGVSLNAGGGGVVIATRAHLDEIEQRLRSRGLDVDAASEQGQYVALDAHKTRTQFLDDGWPHEVRFVDVVGAAIARAGQGRPRVHAFGEMVALMWAEGNHAAAIRTEQLWNDLATRLPFSLLCAYPIGCFGNAAHTPSFLQVCAEHSTVIPVETYTGLPTADERLRIIAQLQQRAQALEVEIAERKQLDDTLIDFLENATEGLQRIGPDGIILWANKAELELLGYAPHEYIGHHVAEFHADRAVIDDMLQRLSQGDSVRDQSARLLCRGGAVKDVLINANALFEDGKLIHTRCFTRDITAQTQADEARARLVAIVDSSDDAIVGKTLDGIIVSWNRGAEKIFGYTATEAVGRSIVIIIPPDRRGEEDEVLARIRRGERIDHYETERRAKDGRKVHISLSVSPIKNADGRVIGVSKIARDITERKRSEHEREELLARERAARAEAETASRVREEFLATLSHELRTPLNAMLGWARMLRSGHLDEAGRRRALEVIERNAQSQNQLIADLLDVSRIITGKMILTVRNVDLAGVVQDALDAVRPTAALKGIDVVAELEGNGEGVWGDPDRLRQVIWNLLSNALKFTPAGGRISASLTYRQGRAVITVSDTGRGIAPEALPLIFERFRQADSSTTRSYGGLGLGLSIVRHLVDLHGGTVWASSEGQGKGATFTVELRVGANPSRTAEGAQTTVAIRTEGVATPSVRLAGVHVLVVDDNPDTCELFRTILVQQGARVTFATSTYEAMRAFENAEPDVMVCDLGMPGRDGLEFIRYIRSHPAGRAVAAVAATAYAKPEDRERALAAGFDEYLSKPVEPVDLVEVIAKVARAKSVDLDAAASQDQ